VTSAVVQDAGLRASAIFASAVAIGRRPERAIR